MNFAIERIFDMDHNLIQEQSVQHIGFQKFTGERLAWCQIFIKKSLMKRHQEPSPLPCMESDVF